MKKTFLIALCAFVLGLNAQKRPVLKTKSVAPISDKMMENAVIYEANIRQYSPEGTLNAFAKDLPKLKKLGVKILWMMPIYPIGIEKRKEGLGSYYSIKDYKGINPEFGNLDDFKALVNKAHENGIYVILDWVANHTSWDHAWVKDHPDYYATDKEGKMISPFDWTDVVKLNYANPDMRKTMISDMSYWLKTANIDGFRCDVAMEVPVDFWDNAFAQLGAIKPVFKLMEAEQPDLMKNAFDMSYGWDFHHIMNDVAQGKKSVKDIDDYVIEHPKKYAKDDFSMLFTSNHDENSWNGSEYERMGAAVEPFAALTYLMPGMPLIYNGQEYDFNKRLKFFTKDVITKTNGKMFAVYEKLGYLKNTNPALNGGKDPATYTRLVTSDDAKILAFERAKYGKKVIYLANLSKEKSVITLPLDGRYTDCITGKTITYKKGVAVDFSPWEYHVLVKK